MGLFGSRDDDPLLQDDPFAPSSDESSAHDDGAATETDPAAPQRRDGSDHTDTRTIAYTQEEATDGALADLNQALVQDWRLDRVQLGDDGQLVFCLQRDTRASGEESTII